MKINKSFIYPSAPLLMDNVYFALRDFLIDKIEIEGFYNVVNQIVESMYKFKEETNKITQRKHKLLTSIHTKSEIKKIVTSNLKHYLKGYSVQNKKNIKYSGAQWQRAAWEAARQIGIGAAGSAAWDGIKELYGEIVDWINTPNEVITIEYENYNGNIVTIVVYDDGSTMTFWVEMVHS